MRTAAIITKDKYLRQKLYLLLTGTGDITVTDAEGAEIILADIDTGTAPLGAITLSRDGGSGADIILPAPLGAILERLGTKGEAAEIFLDEGSRTVRLGSTSARLTELEFSLFSLLAKRGGFVSREEILEKIWQGKADAGIINVYIHYLRQKLEVSGEKIIISSRSAGYRIAERYTAVRGGNGNG